MQQKKEKDKSLHQRAKRLIVNSVPLNLRKSRPISNKFHVIKISMKFNDMTNGRNTKFEGGMMIMMCCVVRYEWFSNASIQIIA